MTEAVIITAIVCLTCLAGLTLVLTVHPLMQVKMKEAEALKIKARAEWAEVEFKAKEKGHYLSSIHRE